jgi:hypothetical protein
LLTLERNEEEKGEVNINHGIKGDERDHGDALHANNAFSVDDFRDTAGKRIG